MDTDQIKALIAKKTIVDFETQDQDFDHGLRLVLRDNDTGEMGLLAVEPVTLALPDERVLEYSYQVIAPPGDVPEHLYDITTRLEPDFAPGETPTLFQ